MTGCLAMNTVFPEWSTVEEDWQALLTEEGRQDLEDALLEAAWLPFPNKNFELGLSTECNFDCPICYNHASEFYAYYPLTTIAPEILQKFILEHAPLQNVVFSVTGEPLLYPNILEWLKFTIQHAATLNLSTNGSLLSEEITDFLATCPMNFIHISIDGAGKDYSRFRKGGSLKRFKENITYLASKLKDKVFLAATVYNQNQEPLLELPKLAAEVGVGQIHFFTLNVHPKMSQRGIANLSSQELEDFLPRLLRRCQEFAITPHWASTFAQASLSQRLAQKMGLDLEVIGAQYQEICFLPFERINVDPLGQINFCCQLEFMPANVFTSGLRSWWNCRAVRIMRVMNICKRFPRVCMNRCHKIRQKDIPLDPLEVWQRMDRFRRQTARYLASRNKGAVL